MRVGALAWLTVLVLAAGGAEAALPPPPFALDVSPARVRAGESVVLRITPLGGSGEYDIYLMWALTPEAAFLGPDGAWSPRPVALRARAAATGPPLELRWVPHPPGEIPLALVVVPAGGDPLARFAWTFRPLLSPVTARGPATGGARAPIPLVIATVLACALVLLAGKPFLA